VAKTLCLLDGAIMKKLFVLLCCMFLNLGFTSHAVSEAAECEKAKLIQDADLYELGHLNSNISGQLNKGVCVDVELNGAKDQLWRVLTFDLERRWIKKEKLKCDPSCPNIPGKSYPARRK